MKLTKKLFGIPIWILATIAISGMAFAGWAAFTSWTSMPTGYAITSEPDVVIEEIEGFDIETIIIDGETSRTKDATFSIAPRGAHTEPFNFSWTTDFELGYCEGINGCKLIYNRTICEANASCSWTVPDCDPEVGPNGERGCRGTAAECSLYTEDIICTEVGCEWGGECTGTPKECSAYGDSTSCTGAGCDWSNDTNKCEGTSYSCSIFVEESPCNEVIGCSWATDCTGDPTPCSEFTETSCEKVEGCFMRDYKVQLFQCQGELCNTLNPMFQGQSVPDLSSDGTFILRTSIQPRSCPGTLSTTVTVSSS